MPSVREAREAFPKGMFQPDQGFRFGLDSLLLLGFVRQKPGERILDLGTGCGVIGLGLCLRDSSGVVEVLGVDMDECMIRAARENARRLGVTQMFTAKSMDIREHRASLDMRAGSFDQVVCNPPYRRVHEGRHPEHGGRFMACFEQEGHIQDFVQAAAYALKNKGRMNVVCLPQRLPDLVQTCLVFRLEPKILRFVHKDAQSRASLMLMTAMKNVRPGMEIVPPLLLSQEERSGLLSS